MMTTDTLMTVGTVAQLAGLTIRTLHHYDEIGLLQPHERSPGGYRLYGQAEIERLQEALFFRELGFALEKIKEILSRPAYERGSALLRQREMSTARADRLVTMIEAVDVAIEANRSKENWNGSLKRRNARGIRRIRPVRARAGGRGTVGQS